MCSKSLDKTDTFGEPNDQYGSEAVVDLVGRERLNLSHIS